MILNRYIKVKKIGAGSFGQVVLAKKQDETKYAIKFIDKKKIQKEAFLLDYLKGQIECMKEMSFSPYMMKMVQNSQDQTHYIIVCEFCNKGDLTNLQAKQYNKVFTLQKSTEIIAQVIKGLEDLHQKRYLHRDLKNQNILVTQDESGKYHYKLADFGFTKKQNQGTICGTQNYMAPQIFYSQGYGVQVDMWALGVVFYFMLNMSLPFKFSNPHADPKQKKKQLIGISHNFSYKKCVLQKSLKKIADNCNEQTQDFFYKVFQANPQKRITFIEIRQHPLFSKYFPQIDDRTISTYTSLRKDSFKNNKIDKIPQKIQVKIQYKFLKQSQIIHNLTGRIQLIKSLEKEFSQLASKQNCLSKSLVLSNLFNMHTLIQLAYTVMLHRKFTLQGLRIEDSTLNWQRFLKSHEFLKIHQQYKNQIAAQKQPIKEFYEKCQEFKDEIIQNNEHFQYANHSRLMQDDYTGDFKKSFQKANRVIYRITRNKYYQKKDSNLLKLMVLSTISYVIWPIVFGPQQKRRLAFKQFYDQQKQSTLRQFTLWMHTTKDQNIKKVTKGLLQVYFQNKQNNQNK